MKLFKKLFGIDKLEKEFSELTEFKNSLLDKNTELERRNDSLEKELNGANFSIKKAIARNIIASENEKNYFLGFLGKERLQDFSSFYEKCKIQLEDMTHQILRNFLKGGKRDSSTYSAAQEIAEGYMSFFAGSYGETQTPLGQDEDVLTND